jgi:hypothetical protein
MADTNVDGVYGIGKSGGMQTEPRASAGGRMLNRKGGEEVVNPARDILDRRRITATGSRRRSREDKQKITLKVGLRPISFERKNDEWKCSRS